MLNVEEALLGLSLANEGVLRRCLDPEVSVRSGFGFLAFILAFLGETLDDAVLASDALGPGVMVDSLVERLANHFISRVDYNYYSKW